MLALSSVEPSDEHVYRVTFRELLGVRTNDQLDRRPEERCRMRGFIAAEARTEERVALGGFRRTIQRAHETDTERGPSSVTGPSSSRDEA